MNKTEQTFYIPENLDIDKLFEDNKEQLAINKIKKPQMLYILDVMLRSRSSNKKVVRYNSQKAAPIWAAMLDKIVHNYNKYLAFLVQHRILITNGSFTKGMSRRYAYSAQYDGQKMKEVVVNDYILRRALRVAWETFKKNFKHINSRKDFLSKWL